MNSIEDVDVLQEIIVKKCTENEGHPYSKLPFGFAGSMSAPNVTQILKEFYSKYYRIGSLTVAVVANRSDAG